MAEVRPLRGIRYAREKVGGDLSQVVTPPYDVISEEDQAGYYARNPYNVIRLELGQTQMGDNELNNVYTRASATLSQWRLEGVLQQDQEPGYYLYQQLFTHGGHSYTRTSLLARVRLEPWSARVILPHEHTLAKAKDDRLKLLRATAANFSPLMSLYDDPQGRIRRLLDSYANRAETRVVDEVGETHLLHPISDPVQVALIQDFFAERQLYIADGHHRYETALAYRAELEEQRRGLHAEDALNFVLMALIDIDDPGMLVLPTHRILFNLDTSTLERLAESQLSQDFDVQPIDATDAVAQLAQAGRGERSALVVSTSRQSWLLILNEQGRQHMTVSEHSTAWNELDVAVAHRLIMESLLGLSEDDLKAGTHVRYLRDAQQALQTVQSGEAQVALLLNGTRVRQVCNVAQADDRMPQKSTYFYPKLATGMVFNPLEE